VIFSKSADFGEPLVIDRQAKSRLQRLSVVVRVWLFSLASMAKSLLILLLLTTQLLAGSRGAVYVCLDSDGSICCLDSGPESCACCKVEEPRCAQSDGECSHHSAAEAEPRKGSLVTIAEDQATCVSGPCECSHVLIAAAVNSAACSTASCETERLARLLDSIQIVAESSSFDIPATPILPANWGVPEPLPSPTLSMIATVVLRC